MEEVIVETFSTEAEAEQSRTKDVVVAVVVT
jgi:hypothetical protein